MGGVDVGLLATAAMHLTGFTPSFSNSYSNMNMNTNMSRAVSTAGTGTGPRSGPSSTSSAGGVNDVSGADSGPWRATGNDASGKMGNSKYGRTLRQLNADKIVKCGEFKILNMVLCDERMPHTDVIENNDPNEDHSNEEHSGSMNDHDRFLYLETDKGVYIYYPDIIEQSTYNAHTVSNGHEYNSRHGQVLESSAFRDSRPMHLEFNRNRNGNRRSKGMLKSEYRNDRISEGEDKRYHMDDISEEGDKEKEKEKEDEREESAGEVEGDDGGNWRDRESESEEEEDEGGGGGGGEEGEEDDMFAMVDDNDKFFRRSSHDRMNEMNSSRRPQQMPQKDRKETSKDTKKPDHEISAPAHGSLIRLLTHTLDGISVGKSDFLITCCSFILFAAVSMDH